MNSDARGFPPLTRLIGQYCAKSQAVFYIGRSYQLFNERPLDVSEEVDRFILPVSGNRYVRLLQFLFFFFRILAAVLFVRPCHVIAVDPPCRLIGLILTLIVRTPVTYLEYDETAKAVTGRQMFGEKCMRMLADTAQAIVVPNSRRMTNFIERYQPSCPVVTLPNHPLRSEFIRADQLVPYTEDQNLRLYYHGSFVEPRMPLALIYAMKILPEVQLVLKPVGGEVWLNTFLNEAKRLGVASRIETFGFLSLDELKKLGSSCHVGISFYGYNGLNDENLRSMWGASNKAVQYAAYGLALLCSTDEVEMSSNVEIGARFCDMNDPTSIAEAIRIFIEDPSFLNRMRSAIHGKASEDWTLEAALMDEGVQRALAMRG
jgi:glycosyltransferase involved in cell wall biosynthesis